MRERNGSSAPANKPPAEADKTDYPTANFYEPVTWGWSEEKSNVRRILKEWSEQTHADD